MEHVDKFDGWVPPLVETNIDNLLGELKWIGWNENLNIANSLDIFLAKMQQKYPGTCSSSRKVTVVLLVLFVL